MRERLACRSVVLKENASMSGCVSALLREGVRKTPIAGVDACEILVAPYRAILRYYRCDNPYRAILFKGGQHSPKKVRYPPLYLILDRRIRAIPHFATHRAIIVRYPIKTSTKEFCDTIATSIARYEKYRCWASKCGI